MVAGLVSPGQGWVARRSAAVAGQIELSPRIEEASAVRESR